MRTMQNLVACGGVVWVVGVWASGHGAADAAVRPVAARPATPAAHKPVEAPPSLPSLSVDQIVAKNVAARGGAEAWQAINAITYSGTLDAGVVRPDNGLNPASTERLLDKPGRSTKPGQAPANNPHPADAAKPVSLPYTLFMERPAKQRMEIRFKGQTLVQVYDGKTGWKLQPYLNRGGAQPFSAEEIDKAKQFQDIDGPLVNYAAKGTRISLDGTDRVDGRAAYRLKLVLRDGATRRVWIDAATFLDVQVDGSRRFNGHEVAVYTAMRDFRSVANVRVPYEMETRTDGTADREKIVVEKVVVNPKLDDTLFSKPT